MKSIFFYIAVILFSGCATIPTSQPLPTVSSLQKWHQKVLRVESIAYKLITSNLTECSDKRVKYGFNLMSLNNKMQPNIAVLYSAAFNLKNASTVTYVLPNSAAYKAGLHVGDNIVAVNNVRYLPSNDGPSSFSRELSKAFLSETMELTRKNESKSVVLSLTGEIYCDVSIHLLKRKEANAFAEKNKIFIEAGLEDLLIEDDELAFIIAHELAHIMLGHSYLDMREDMQSGKNRTKIENDADAFAIKLMAKSNYNPRASFRVIPKMDNANRGPITKLIGHYGDYLPTEERVKLLKEHVDKLYNK